MTSRDTYSVYATNPQVSNEFQTVDISTQKENPQSTQVITVTETAKPDATKSLSSMSFIEKATMVCTPATIIVFFCFLITVMGTQIAGMARTRNGLLANNIVSFIFELPLFVVGVIGILSIIPKFSHGTQIKLGAAYLLALFVMITIEHILTTSFFAADAGASFVIPTIMAFFLVIPVIIRSLHLNSRLESDPNNTVSLAEKISIIATPILAVGFMLWLVAVEGSLIALMAKWNRFQGGGFLANYIITFIFVLPLFVFAAIYLASIIPAIGDTVKLAMQMVFIAGIILFYTIELILQASFIAGSAGGTFVVSELMVLFLVGNSLIRSYYLKNRAFSNESQ
jgi:hypothetical protein